MGPDMMAAVEELQAACSVAYTGYRDAGELLDARRLELLKACRGRVVKVTWGWEQERSDEGCSGVYREDITLHLDSGKEINIGGNTALADCIDELIYYVDGLEDTVIDEMSNEAIAEHVTGIPEALVDIFLEGVSCHLNLHLTDYPELVLAA